MLFLQDTRDTLASLDQLEPLCKKLGRRATRKRFAALDNLCPLSGVKRTCLLALHMSAYDPKRTLGLEHGLCFEPRLSSCSAAGGWPRAPAGIHRSCCCFSPRTAHGVMVRKPALRLHDPGCRKRSRLLGLDPGGYDGVAPRVFNVN
jgi:hypothetical protein